MSSALSDGHVESGPLNIYTGKSYSPRYFSLLEKRSQLPVNKYREQLLSQLEKSRCLVLVGDTGSGKTTQIPQFLVHHLQPQKSGRIVGCTQPRRVAAMSVAKRVSEEMDVELGKQVGYTIRFEDMSGPATLLKHVHVLQLTVQYDHKYGIFSLVLCSILTLYSILDI